MKRLAFVVLMSMSIASFAGKGDPVPLCSTGSPSACVVPNWGQVQPDGVDASIVSSGGQSLASTPSVHRPQVAVEMMPTETMTSSGTPPVQSVVSPQNLFPKETAALLSALQRARFNPDGSIKSGKTAIAKAAAAAAQRAGQKYILTLYIKVAQGLKPDQGSLLGKKVDALNAVLGGAHDGGQTGTPKT